MAKNYIGTNPFFNDVDDAQKLDCSYIPGQIIQPALCPDIKWQRVMIITTGRKHIKIY